MINHINEREEITGVHPQFLQRWSPRAFNNKPIALDVLSRIVDAVRWTPSCYNEQPWRIYTSNSQNKTAYLSCLDSFNQQWACCADVIGFIVANMQFEKNGNANSYAHFDCGAAWMAMTLQALHENVYMRAMGGIDKSAVTRCLNLSAQQQVMIGFAMGYPDHSNINHDFDDTENSVSRKRLDAIWITNST